MGLRIFNLEYPGLVFLALHKLLSRWVATLKVWGPNKTKIKETTEHHTK